jgi:hypothetical protein
MSADLPMADEKPVARPPVDPALALRRQGQALAEAISAARKQGYVVDASDLENIIVSATRIVET